MVGVRQDVPWAFAGEPVVLESTSATGDRTRFRLTAKPYDSALDLYDANEENYLPSRGEYRAQIVPDVPGVYTVVCTDESVSVNVKHFSNDGGLNLSKGLETSTTLTSATHSVIVGETLTRQFGVGADTVELTIKAHQSGALSGVMTYYAGKGYTATLTGASTPAVDMAVRSTGVARVMGYYGMSSGYGGNNTVIDWGSYTEPAETTLARIAAGFNKHVVFTSVAVHDHEDTTNKMSGVTDPSTLPTLVSYSNTFKGKVQAHFALATGAAHPFGTDATTTITVGTATTLNSSRLLLINIKSAIDTHKLVHTTSAHYAPGDNDEDSITPWYEPNAADSTSTVCSFASALADSWDAHLANDYSAVTIHAATGSANAMLARTGTTWDELQELANDCATKLEAHASNRVFDTGSAASYHGSVDKSCVVPFRAGDRRTTVQLIDHLLWVYLQHTVYGGGAWHGSKQNAGDGYVDPRYATTRLQHAILDRIKGNDTNTPPNTLVGVNALINLGFVKA